MISEGARTVVLAALVVNLGLVAAKLWGGQLTGSSVMLSTLVHSLIDVSAQTLMLLGLGRGRSDGRSPATRGQVGFWCFLVSVPLYAMGAGVTLYEGIERWARPLATTGSTLELAVVGIAAALAVGVAWAVWRRLEPGRSNRRTPLLAVLRLSENAPLFAVLLQALAGYAGSLIALCGIVAARHAGLLVADAIASIAIGIVLCGMAAAMAIEVKQRLGLVDQTALDQIPAILPDANEATGAGLKPFETKFEPTPAAQLPDVPRPTRVGDQPEADTAGAIGSLNPGLSSPGSKPQIMARPRSAKKRHGKRRR